jgi:hypothetical protein
MILLGALGLFAAALFEPAVLHDPWCNAHQGLESGLTCLLAGVGYYPSNALLIVSPVIALLSSHARRPYAQMFLMAIAIASTFWVAQVPFSRGFVTTGVGCDHWVEAHVLMTFAFFIPVWRWRPIGPEARKTECACSQRFPGDLGPSAPALASRALNTRPAAG